MKKLLFITWSVSYGYGTEKSLADILNRLDKSKYSIDVFPLFKNSKNSILNSDINVLEPLIDYTKENYDKKRDMDYYYSILANPLKFNKLIKNKYDCVIACNHNAPSYFASYMNNTPKVVWIRGDMSELNYNNFNPTTVEYSGIKQEYNMQKNVLKTFDNIVVISEVVKKALEENFGITENIYEIPNSVDTEKIKSLSNEKILLPGKHLFTTLGRLDKNKNQILLLKAAKLVKRYRDDFKIYLLGDGEERKKLETYIEATILTSLSEGFSLALAESAILNTPIISTNVGIAKELIEKYDCGTLINYDEKELAETLLKYMKQNDMCKEKRDFNIGNEFDIQMELERTIQVIDDTIDKAEGKTKIKKLPYPVEKIDYYDLENYKVKENLLYMRKQPAINYLFGFSFDKSQDNKLSITLIEMDPFDSIFRFGIIGCILIYLPSILIFIQILLKIFKTKTIKLLTCHYLISFVLGIVISTLVGHVISAPAVSIYLTLSLILLYYSVSNCNKEE